MAIVRCLVAHRVGDLELTAVAEAWSAELLVAAGLLRKVRISDLMFEGLGRCRAVSRRSNRERWRWKTTVTSG